MGHSSDFPKRWFLEVFVLPSQWNPQFPSPPSATAEEPRAGALWFERPDGSERGQWAEPAPGGGETARRRRAVQPGGTRASEVAVAKGTRPAQDWRTFQPSWFRLGKMAVAGAAPREQLVGWCTQHLRQTFGLDVSEEIMQ